MDQIKDLAAFQGVMLSADNYHSFSKLTSKGGNEEKVKYVIEKLRDFLMDKNYIGNYGIVKENRGEYKKLALYIALNADLPILETMTETEGMDMVIWMIPTVPRYLMCEIFWNLHMGEFLYEIIVFCCPRFAVQVAEAFLAHMKYLNPVEHLDRFRLVSAALYRYMCRLHFYVDAYDPDVLTAALNNFQICLNNFINPPNADKVLNLHKDDQYKYLGRSLSTMLHLMEECLTIFSAKEELEADGCDPIYLSTIHEDTFHYKALDYKICDSDNDELLECLNKCHTFLLDDCTTLVMNVSVDIFCAWSEYEENGKTMQQTIGESCFKMRLRLLKMKGLCDHGLMAMLKQISREPIDPKVLINDTPFELIVEKINAKDDESSIWVGALLYRRDLCDNVNLLLLLEANLYLLNEEQNLELFKKATEYLNAHPESSETSMDQRDHREYMKILAVKAFQRCLNSVKYDITIDQFSDHFHDKMECGDFNDMMTEIFNKLTAFENSNPSDILTVFIQNPKKVFTKIFKLAAENEKQREIMLKVLRCLKKFYNHYYRSDTESCIIKVIHDVIDDGLDTDAKRKQFVQFLRNLKQRHIITMEKLLILIVMPHLHKALLEKDIIGIKMQIDILSTAFTMSEIDVDGYRAPILAMLGQVMDTVRWRFTTFQATMPSTLEAVLKLQTRMFESYLSLDQSQLVISEQELLWLRGKVKYLRPLNRRYFRRLWYEHDRESHQLGVERDGEDDFLQQATGIRWITAPSPLVTAMLVQILAPLSAQEFDEVYCAIVVGETARAAATEPSLDERKRLASTYALQKLHEALLLLGSAEKHNRTVSTWGCMLNCYRNLTLVIKNKYFEDPPTADQVMTVVHKIVSVINNYDESCTEDLTTTFMPLLAYIAEKRSDCSPDIVRYIREKATRESFATALAPLFPGAI